MDHLKGLRIEYHILQSFPVTCLNRDDVGAPKSAIIGGVPRARVSSQCWKRQVRLAMHDMGIKTGIRTKRLNELLNAACKKAGANDVQAENCAERVANALADNTLFFFSEFEADAVAQFAKDSNFDPDKLAAEKKGLTKELKQFMKTRCKPALDGLDIALFGRMAAQDPDMNMQAASCFAHAITTHKVSNEIDFFTALDDLKNEPGSAHMGSLEFNSGTYYRYISLDLGQLAANLPPEDIGKAVAAFTKALYVAVPSARQTTQTGLRPWDYAHVLVRRGQGMQASFEKPVYSQNGYLEPSIEALEAQIDRNEKLAGSLYGKVDAYIFGKDANFNIDMLASKLAAHAAGARQ